MNIIFSINDKVRWFGIGQRNQSGVISKIDIIEGLSHSGDEVTPSNMVCYTIRMGDTDVLIPQERLAYDNGLTSASHEDFLVEMKRRGYV